jgi:AcrR family transcriptional regulator
MTPVAQKPRANIQRKQIARRRDVAQASFAVIAREGLEGMSMRAIAAEMECSTGVLTHHFRDKAALIKFVLDVMLEELSEQLESAEGKDAQGSLEKFILVLLPNDPETEVRWRVFLAFTAASVNEASLRQDQERRESVLHDWLVRMIEGLKQAERLPSDLDADLEAHFLLCFIDGLGMHTLVAPKLFNRKRQKQLVERYFRTMDGRP